MKVQVISASASAGRSPVVAKLLDTGIPDGVIYQLRELTKPGQTVLALLVSDWSAGAVVQELRRFQGAHIVYAELPASAVVTVRQALHDS